MGGKQSASVVIRMQDRHRGAHDEETAAVACDSRVGALVEYDRVVAQCGVPAVANVTDAGRVTCAQIAANPVVVEQGSSRSRCRC